MKNALIATGIILTIIAVVLFFVFPNPFKHKAAPTAMRTFEDCAAAGNLVVDTIPRECHTKTDQVFLEVYNGATLIKVIKTTDPKPNAVVSSPFKVAGEAVGGWYYNEQLSVRLEDDYGKILATKNVKALKSTKMDSFVPFVGAISFSKKEATTSAGKLIIERTNDYFSKGELGPLVIPVVFGD